MNDEIDTLLKKLEQDDDFLASAIDDDFFDLEPDEQQEIRDTFRHEGRERLLRLGQMIDRIIDHQIPLYRGIDVPGSCQEFAQKLKTNVPIDWTPLTTMPSAGNDQLTGIGLCWTGNLNIAMRYGNCILEAQPLDRSIFDLKESLALDYLYGEEELRLNPKAPMRRLFINQLCEKSAYHFNDDDHRTLNKKDATRCYQIAKMVDF